LADKAAYENKKLSTKNAFKMKSKPNLVIDVSCDEEDDFNLPLRSPIEALHEQNDQEHFKGLEELHNYDEQP
jgi:hypothetical protein